MQNFKPRIKIATVVFSSVLYGVLNYALAGFVFPGSEFITLRPQIVVPVLVGILFGPLSGALVGGVGNLFGDILLGYGFDFWPWIIANIIIGGVSGLTRVLNLHLVEKVNDFATVLLLVFIANFIGLFVGYILHVLIIGDSSVLTINTFLLPAIISNVYILLLVLPPILKLIGYLKINIETRVMFNVIMLSMVLISFLATVFLVVEFREFKFLISHTAELDFDTYWSAIVSQSVRWIGIIVIFVTMIAIFTGYSYSKRYVRPVHKLSEAALKISKGKWDREDALFEVKESSDLSGLIRVFNKMATDVAQREAKMNETISALQFRIDKSEENKKIEEITETDFFKSIEKKSKEIRRKKEH